MLDKINWLSIFLTESRNHLLTIPLHSLTDKIDSETLKTLELQGLQINYANYFSAELFDFSQELPIDDTIAICYLSGRMTRQITPLLKTMINNMLYKITAKNTHLIILLEDVKAIEFSNFYLLAELAKSERIATITVMDNQVDLKTRMGIDFVRRFTDYPCLDYIDSLPISDLIVFEDFSVRV